MPRHPPIALKTLDRSHCQYPSRDFEEIVASAKPLAGLAKRDPEGIVASAKLCAEPHSNGIGTKRPASRDPFEGAVRQTHHRQGIERPLRQIMALSGHEVRTNLLFTMSNRTGGKRLSLPQTLFTDDFFSWSLLDTSTRRSCGSRARQTATWRPQATILRIAHWWSRTGSNRRHPACKAGALPAELRPLIVPDRIDRQVTTLRVALFATILADCAEMVGLGGLEPPTSRLSSARSNQLSYKP